MKWPNPILMKRIDCGWLNKFYYRFLANVKSFKQKAAIVHALQIYGFEKFIWFCSVLFSQIEQKELHLIRNNGKIAHEFLLNWQPFCNKYVIQNTTKTFI